MKSLFQKNSENIFKLNVENSLKENIVAIIPARQGSKGISNKNIKDFCGKPLIYWTIKNALDSKEVSNVFVSSDSKKILDISEKYGATPLERPKKISGDNSASESAWKHALSKVEEDGKVDLVIGMQATSPIRGKKDISNALKIFKSNDLDSLMTVTEVEDNFLWEERNNKLHSVNYDYKNRSIRQKIKKKYLENGSFYIFKPEVLKKYNNRLGGKKGKYIMEKYKSFQIDNFSDFKLCESIMKGHK